MKAVFIYVTTSGEAEARSIAHDIVADRLAACANILPGMKSVYHWEGKVAEGDEAVLILKTRAELFPAVETRVRELHSYKTPCIVALPVDDGSAPFMSWLMAETKP